MVSDTGLERAAQIIAYALRYYAKALVIGTQAGSVECRLKKLAEEDAKSH